MFSRHAREVGNPGFAPGFPSISMALGATTSHESLSSSFPQFLSGNPDASISLDPRQEHARVTGWALSYKTCADEVPG